VRRRKQRDEEKMGPEELVLGFAVEKNRTAGLTSGFW
jgi:hypothetical protein